MLNKEVTYICEEREKGTMGLTSLFSCPPSLFLYWFVFVTPDDGKMRVSFVQCMGLEYLPITRRGRIAGVDVRWERKRGEIDWDSSVRR